MLPSEASWMWHTMPHKQGHPTVCIDLLCPCSPVKRQRMVLVHKLCQRQHEMRGFPQTFKKLQKEYNLWLELKLGWHLAFGAHLEVIQHELQHSFLMLSKQTPWASRWQLMTFTHLPGNSAVFCTISAVNTEPATLSVCSGEEAAFCWQETLSSIHRPFASYMSEVQLLSVLS